jgi:putative transposase
VKTPDADLLPESIGFAKQRLKEIDGLGTDGEPGCLVKHNGYRDRVWETRARTNDLGIRKLSTQDGGRC